MKALFTTSLLAVSVALTACQGTNPFKMQANPKKGYPALEQGTQKFQAAATIKQPDKPDNTQVYCPPPFQVAIDNNLNQRVLRFADGNSSNHKFHIKNRFGDATSATVSIVNGPTQTFNSNNGVLDFDFAWSPTQAATEQGVIDASITLNSTKAASCGNSTIPLSIVVSRTPDQIPTFDFDFSKSKINIEFGQTVTFTVNVTDPAATQARVPHLNKFKLASWQQSAEHPIFDLSSVVFCNPVEGTHFTFSCKINTQALDQSLVKDLLNSGRMVEGAFSGSATSTASGKTSVDMASTHIMINFADNKPKAVEAAPVVAPVVAPKAEETQPAPAPTEKVVEKAPEVKLELAPTPTEKVIPTPIPRPAPVAKTAAPTTKIVVPAAKPTTPVVAAKAPVVAPKTVAPKKVDAKTAPKAKTAPATDDQAAADKAQDKKQDEEEFGADAAPKKKAKKVVKKKPTKKVVKKTPPKPSSDEAPKKTDDEGAA